MTATKQPGHKKRVSTPTSIFKFHTIPTTTDQQTVTQVNIQVTKPGFAQSVWNAKGILGSDESVRSLKRNIN